MLQKLGKTGADIFKSTGRPQTVPEKTSDIGRNDPWTRVNHVLYNRNLSYLDTLRLTIRDEGSGASLNRSEIIRAFIDAIEEAGIDLSHITSEEWLKLYLASLLKVK